MSERSFRSGIRGYGFIGTDDRVYLVRCGDCGRENYGPAVASGTCAWCGAKPDAPEALAQHGKERE